MASAESWNPGIGPVVTATTVMDCAVGSDDDTASSRPSSAVAAALKSSIVPCSGSPTCRHNPAGAAAATALAKKRKATPSTKARKGLCCLGQSV